MLYNWGVISILLLFLFGIAQFFEQRLSEKNSERPKHLQYPLFLLPIVLFIASALIYAINETLVVGNIWADSLRVMGAVIFIYAGYALLRTMVGGKS